MTEGTVPIVEQARKVELMCDAYPGMTPAMVVNELALRFHRARDHHAAAERGGAVGIFDRLIGWMDANGHSVAHGQSQTLR